MIKPDELAKPADTKRKNAEVKESGRNKKSYKSKELHSVPKEDEPEKKKQNDVDMKLNASVPPENDRIIKKHGINPKVFEVTNTATKETKVFLNGNEYYPDENLPTKLTARMTSFGEEIERQLRYFLNEIQQEDKVSAMTLIGHLNIFLKVFRKWKECSCAANFVTLEREAWSTNSTLVSEMKKLFDCEGFNEDQGIFSFS